jgi:two-component sensor histidine kinase
MVLVAAAQYGLILFWMAMKPYNVDAVLYGWMPLNAFVTALILMSRWFQDRNEKNLQHYREHLEEMVDVRSRDLREAHRKVEERLVREQEISRDLEGALSQKQVLLKELYHRTKNNMQIIDSLLAMQFSNTDSGSKAFFKIARDRIRSMALVHEKLYESGDLTTIDLAEYLRDLAGELFHSHGVEAGTNALKYAFPQGRKGNIRIRIAKGEGDLVELEVGDDGIGFPEGADFRKGKGLGHKLVFSIIEDQLDGTVRIVSGKGAQILIQFTAKAFGRKEVVVAAGSMPHR